MTAFDSYATKYSCIRMRRENGILATARMAAEKHLAVITLTDRQRLPVTSCAEQRLALATAFGPESGACRSAAGIRKMG